MIRKLCKLVICVIVIVTVGILVICQNESMAKGNEAASTYRVDACISCRRVTLSYSGPENVTIGKPEKLNLTLTNNSDSDLVLGSPLDDDTSNFLLEISTLKGIRIPVEVKTNKLPRCGNGLVSLGAGKAMTGEEIFGKQISLNAGQYKVKLAVSFNGVVHFPLQSLEIGEIGMRVVDTNRSYALPNVLI